MKTRTKVILGVVAALAFTLAATRAARQAKWQRWVAEQEFKFRQARFVTPAPALSGANVSCLHLPCADRAEGAAGTGGPQREVAATDGAQLANENRRQDAGATQEHQHHGAATAAMSGGHHQHMEAHMRWTAPHAETLNDLARASDIVSTLRASLVRYKDYKAAIADGYQPFLPHLDLPMYHFTNYRLAIADAFRFDAAKPSSLLYRKHATGYELIGVMYTAPRRFSEAQLDERVPLSIARWHQHVNICLPPGTPAERARADWTRFGFTGSIATESACKKAGGRWRPVIFGWMVHVYPFEETQEKIWTH